MIFKWFGKKKAQGNVGVSASVEETPVEETSKIIEVDKVYDSEGSYLIIKKISGDLVIYYKLDCEMCIESVEISSKEELESEIYWDIVPANLEDVLIFIQFPGDLSYDLKPPLLMLDKLSSSLLTKYEASQASVEALTSQIKLLEDKLKDSSKYNKVSLKDF